MIADLRPFLDLDACVEHLRGLIRIPSVNPPDGGPEVAAGLDPRGGEATAARYCAEILEGAGIPSEVIELTPGRGSCVARLAASGAATEPPIVLLGHIDVVPVDAEAWTRDPFGAELVDGVVWGRGAIDMKSMVAMELAVMLAIRRSGADLRRDVIFGCRRGGRWRAGRTRPRRAAARALPRRGRTPGSRGAQRGRWLLDHAGRPAVLHDPGCGEGDLVDAAAHDRHDRPRLDAT
jgi:hypothetical protein